LNELSRTWSGLGGLTINLIASSTVSAKEAAATTPATAILSAFPIRRFARLASP
jgi:hypothetical protein